MADHEKPGIWKLTVNPYSLRETGTTPDYRFSLANERTFLAWLRTALALIGGGIAVAQFLDMRGRTVVAIALLVLGAACAVRAVAHWTACERAMRRGEDLPASRFPTLLATLVTLGALALIIAVLTGRFAP